MARAVRSSTSQHVEVRGLDKFIRDAKKAGDDIVDRMKLANNLAAAVVLDRAVELRDSQPGAAQKTTIRTGNQANRASIVIGSAKEPWALGAEFGAKRFPQFQRWNGNQWRDSNGDKWAGADPNVGYFLHPAIDQTRDEFLAAYDEQVQVVLDDLARE